MKHLLIGIWPDGLWVQQGGGLKHWAWEVDDISNRESVIRDLMRAAADDDCWPDVPDTVLVVGTSSSGGPWLADIWKESLKDYSAHIDPPDDWKEPGEEDEEPE